MEIIYKKIDELIPYKNNPRFNDEAVEYVKNSIKEFGFKVPIVIDKDNVIIAGHTRIKASKELGIKDIPCIIADDLTEEQVKAFRLADNKVSEKSMWDYSKLDEELNSIIDIDMSMFDFNLPNLDDIEENDLEEPELKDNDTKLHKCPECGCEFED
jgi:ParB-like chromosome segregation protein Spo0J